ncbi:SPV088 putative late transcription factor VLTF-2 [Swinepox virus]|uniref:Viral late gene transcription factor 2 n=2 Tax=Swinepox virus TaxID=10276 RepID=Q8V3K8_SWPV1|nr:late transcription factor VLTF-2 [Swinepox virus]AAL69827.1 SPV088 putative late transcription factor VLTF-2 [Swinepox virus]QQG31578.1 late transcription factor VLTF-2 [Swinepox virus]UED36647.1 late transcription factor VLTF-2 [Swinepox virus]UED36796.1 late transcription factor VLTF-2 [Swinepox virus]UUA44278.1 SPV088 [Swinepox virus]
MAKKVSLSNITISSPKAVIKQVKDESITSILPSYYTSEACMTVKMNHMCNCCWFCSQDIILSPLHIETMKGNNVGNFCSSICRDSFASMIKSNVALREEPKATILPLICYDKPNEIINIINLLRNKEGIYGNCYYKEKDNSIQISLRSLL